MDTTSKTLNLYGTMGVKNTLYLNVTSDSTTAVGKKIIIKTKDYLKNNRTTKIYKDY